MKIAGKYSYIVQYCVRAFQDMVDMREVKCIDFKSAVNTYRKIREEHGDSTRLLKVVIDYGEEV